MSKPPVLTRILAVTGAVLTGLPLLLPVVFGLTHLFETGTFLLDYLMPAELFFLTLAGGAALIWAAARQRALLRPMIAWLAASAGFLVISQIAAVVTGLASSPAEVADWRMTLVTALLAVFIFCSLGLFAAGIRLAIITFRNRQ